MAKQPEKYIPDTLMARRAFMASIIRSGTVHSQSEISDRLKEQGISVTQPTIGRDLEALGAIKSRSAETGKGVYIIPHDADSAPTKATALVHLTRLLRDLMVSGEACQGTLVLRTPPGAAQYLASAIDKAQHDAVAGCIAGDDTIFIQVRDGYSSHELAKEFKVEKE